MAKAQQKSEVLVLVGSTNGLVVVPQPTVLTRLHYYDGKLLRADDLKKEQDYLRSLVHLSNRAGGFGVVDGFDLTLSTGGNALVVGPGMAIDPNGRVLLLPVSGTQLDIDQLIQKSQATGSQTTGNGAAAPSASAASFVNCLPSSAATPAPDHTPRDTSLYLITVGFAEALCGQDDVFGKVCEEACVGSTDRPFTIEGLVFRAIPLILQTPLATSTEIVLGPEHRRSLVASAYFEDEQNALPHLISGAGLRMQTWCKGALLFCGNEVALGVLSRSGSQTQFLDTWIARRERMEDAPRRYWAMRMAMRPWNVYLAQILQFQCQLAEILKGQAGPGTPDDPCATALNTAAELLKKVRDQLGEVGDAAGALQELEAFLSQAKTDVTALPGERMLIEGGIVELPPAGYLPVSPTALATVNEQVRKMVGEGLDLRFCIVRPDYVAHALEEAQHMERISLLHGIDHPGDKPQVDILVPDGEIQTALNSKGLLLFRTTVAVNAGLFGDGEKEPVPNDPAGEDAVAGDAADEQTTTYIEVQGASRVEPLIGRGAAFHLAGVAKLPVSSAENAKALMSQAGQGPHASGWVSVRAESNPFTAKAGDVVPLSGNGALALSSEADGGVAQANVGGNLRVLAASHPSANEWSLLSKLELFLSYETRGKSGNVEKGGTQATINAGAVFKGSAAAGDLTVSLSPPDSDGGGVITLEVHWGGNPLTATAKLSGTSESGEKIEAGSVQLVLDPDVLDPANQWHGLALQAVSAIGVALKDALFADAAENLLFPSPQGDGVELIVRAVKDWVLFHRRRTKRCSYDVVKPALPPRRYQLFTVALDDLPVNVPPSPQSVYNAFAKGSTSLINMVREHSEPVAIVEYAGGKATLLTQEPTIKAAWQATVGESREVVLGMIATRGADDVSVLEVARVERVEQVVASLTPPAGDAVAKSLSDVPSQYDVPGTDGFILCATMPAVVAETECQSAFVLELPRQYWNDSGFDPLLQEIAHVLEALGTDKALVPGAHLGSVDFQQGTTTMVGQNTVAQEYAQWSNGMPHDVTPVFCHAFVPPGSNLDPGQPPHPDRALAVGQILDQGVYYAEGQAPIKNTPVLAQCPVSAVVAAVPVHADVIAVDTSTNYETLRYQYLETGQLPDLLNVNVVDAKIRFKGDVPDQADIEEVATKLGFIPGSFQPPQFRYMTITDADSGAAGKLNSLWAALLNREVVTYPPTGEQGTVLVNNTAPFTDPQFKTNRSRYVVFLFRYVD